MFLISPGILSLRIFVFLLAYVFSAFSSTAEKQTVYLYTYHNKPPFIVDTDSRQGLYFDLARLLSENSQSYRFITTYLPRKRLDFFIANDQLDGVVIGVSPIWFRDKEEKKFLWLPPIYQDADEFVSLKATPFEYDGRPSLTRKTLASVAGYYYFGINEAVAEGILTRIDVVGEREVLGLVGKARVDIGIVSQSVFKYLRRHQLLEDKFHFSTRKHDEFARRAFTTLQNKDVHQEMSALIALIEANGSWQEMISNYE